MTPHALSNSSDFSERAWLVRGSTTSGVWVLETEDGLFVAALSTTIDGDRITVDFCLPTEWKRALDAAADLAGSHHLLVS